MSVSYDVTASFREVREKLITRIEEGLEDDPEHLTSLRRLLRKVSHVSVYDESDEDDVQPLLTAVRYDKAEYVRIILDSTYQPSYREVACAAGESMAALMGPEGSCWYRASQILATILGQEPRELLLNSEVFCELRDVFSNELQCLDQDNTDVADAVRRVCQAVRNNDFLAFLLLSVPLKKQVASVPSRLQESWKPWQTRAVQTILLEGLDCCRCLSLYQEYLQRQPDAYGPRIMATLPVLLKYLIPTQRQLLEDLYRDLKRSQHQQEWLDLISLLLHRGFQCSSIRVTADEGSMNCSCRGTEKSARLPHSLQEHCRSAIRTHVQGRNWLQLLQSTQRNPFVPTVLHSWMLLDDVRMEPLDNNIS